MPEYFTTTGVIDEDALVSAVQSSKNNNKKIVMTNGCFDIVHTGHERFLAEAKSKGDYLIVAVNDDDSVKRLKGENRPVNTLENRMTVLAEINCVDWVVPFSEDTPERIICKVLPDMLVKGGDYTAEEVAGGSCVTENNGEVLILAYHDGFSTTKIIEESKK